MELEDNLMQELADFEQFIDSLKGEVSGELDEIIGSLKRTANKELSKYSGIAKMTSKPERAKALIACLDEMKQLALTLAKLPERDETIEQEYTDEVWNPFTSTTMTEKIKKRIFKAYEEVLKPHYFEQIKNNLSCSNAEDWKDRLDTTHERMLALTGENTSRIERKLKNEEEPKVVMELLRISIN